MRLALWDGGMEVDGCGKCFILYALSLLVFCCLFFTVSKYGFGKFKKVFFNGEHGRFGS